MTVMELLIVVILIVDGTILVEVQKLVNAMMELIITKTVALIVKI